MKAIEKKGPKGGSNRIDNEPCRGGGILSDFTSMLSSKLEFAGNLLGIGRSYLQPLASSNNSSSMSSKSNNCNSTRKVKKTRLEPLVKPILIDENDSSTNKRAAPDNDDLVRKQALFQYAISNIAKKKAVELCRYKNERTLERDMQIVRENLGLDVIGFNSFKKDETNHVAIATAINKMVYNMSGPRPLLDGVEITTLALEAECRDRSGNGYDRKMFGKVAAEFLHQKAEYLSLNSASNNGNSNIISNSESNSNGRDDVYISRLRDAKGSRYFMNKNLEKLAVLLPPTKKSDDPNELDVYNNAKYTKNCNLSAKRAAAASPALDKAQFLAYKKANESIYQNGNCGKGGVKANRTYILDEMGRGPDAKRQNPKFSLMKTTGERRDNITSGERNPWWVSWGFIARSDGKILKVQVCHQSASETTIRSDLFSGFDPDLEDFIIVTANSSGYFSNEHDLVYMKIIHEDGSDVSDSEISPPEEPSTDTPRLSRSAEKKRSLPQKRLKSWKIAYGDGHSSHKRFEAKKWAREQGIEFRFLRSNNSTRDSALDMGINGKFGGILDDAISSWRLIHMNETITPFIWNGIFSKALIAFLADPKLKACIIDSFVASGLFPLTDPETINVTNNVNKVVSNIIAGEAFIADKTDAKKAKSLRETIQGTREVMVIDAEDVGPGQKAIVF